MSVEKEMVVRKIYLMSHSLKGVTFVDGLTCLVIERKSDEGTELTENSVFLLLTSFSIKKENPKIRYIHSKLKILSQFGASVIGMLTLKKKTKNVSES